jgi:G3E family GTPase
MQVESAIVLLSCPATQHNARQHASQVEFADVLVSYTATQHNHAHKTTQHARPALQVEFADVLVLNKLDIVTPEQADQLEALLHKLNRGAKVGRDLEQGGY